MKAQISGKLATSGMCDIAFASVYSEKTHLKKLIMIFIISITEKVNEKRRCRDG